MAPRGRDPEATKNAILDAAETIFLENGFGNTSLSAIAREAGITKSLIHHHFGSKAGLWQEVKQRRFMAYAQLQMEMLADAPPTADLLRESMRFYFHFLRDNPQLVRIMAWMFLERDQEHCIDMDRKLIELGTQKLQDAQASGQFRSDVDPRFMLFTFIGLIQHWFQDKEHFCHDFGTDGFENDLDNSYLEAIIKIFFEGVLVR